LTEAAGYVFRRQSGSHKNYKHPDLEFPQSKKTFVPDEKNPKMANDRDLLF